jgi:hypothetical protein
MNKRGNCVKVFLKMFKLFKNYLGYGSKRNSAAFSYNCVATVGWNIGRSYPRKVYRVGITRAFRIFKLNLGF